MAGGSFLDELEHLREENEALRKELRITLYGPFHPPSEKQKLQNLAKILRDEGYSDCGIVESVLRPNPPDEDGERWAPDVISKFYLQHSDLNFLIYTEEGPEQGAVVEGTMLSSDPELVDATNYSYAYVEETEGHDVLGDMAESRFSGAQIPIQPFADLEGLERQLVSRANMEFRKLRPKLKQRST